jgi:hypothetical protein
LYADDNVKDCYPSIFDENTYYDLIKNLKDIPVQLLNKKVINNEIHDYIFAVN